MSDNVVPLPSSWTEGDYKKTPLPEDFHVLWRVTARRESDRTVLEQTFEDEGTAVEFSRRLFAAGYDIKGDRCHVYKVARWFHYED
jgi:hypothetical protein